MKPERAFVYVCDRVFTLSSAPIPSDGEKTRPPTALLLSHYLSVCGIFVMENMCWPRMCVRVLRLGKANPVLCPHYNQLNHSTTSDEFKDRRKRRKPREKTMTNGHDSDLWTARHYYSFVSHTCYKYHKHFFVLTRKVSSKFTNARNIIPSFTNTCDWSRLKINNIHDVSVTVLDLFILQALLLPFCVVNGNMQQLHGWQIARLALAEC